MERFTIERAVAPAAREALRRSLRGRVVYLASASPRRRALLSVCGIKHRAMPHLLEEPSPAGPDWRRWVRAWSLRKARDTARNLRSGLVIGSDTIVVRGRRAFGKPVDSSQAEAFLERLSGREHSVITGVAVGDIDEGCWATGSELTRVRFRRLSLREIRGYVKSGEAIDKAGAYAIQGHASRFVSQVDGPLDNVIGLPIGCLVRVVSRVIG